MVVIAVGTCGDTVNNSFKQQIFSELFCVSNNKHNVHKFRIRCEENRSDLEDLHFL